MEVVSFVQEKRPSRNRAGFNDLRFYGDLGRKALRG